MDCNENWETIGDYLDGTLEHDSASAFDAHLVTCERCRSIAADLRTLRDAARALEPSSPPARVWTALARAVQEPRLPVWRSLTSGVFMWRPLASAAMLVLIVAGLTWVGGRLSLNTRVPDGQVASGFSRTPQEVSLDGSVDAELRLAEAQYAEAIASLETIARRDTTGLDEHTAEVLRSSVADLDEAIGESRAALESEPTNQLAQESLFDALRSKVALLQETVALMNELQQGGVEGTGSAPGLNQ